VQSIDNYDKWRDERGGVFASEYGSLGIPQRPEPTRDRPETDIAARNELGLPPEPLSAVRPAPTPGAQPTTKAPDRRP
jgi:hypothetical protein